MDVSILCRRRMTEEVIFVNWLQLTEALDSYEKKRIVVKPTELWLNIPIIKPSDGNQAKQAKRDPL